MSLVGDAYVEIGARMDKMVGVFSQAKTEAEKSTGALSKTVEAKSGFAALAKAISEPIVRGAAAGLTFLASKGEAVIKKLSGPIQAMIAGMVAFSTFGDFPHAKVFQRTLEAIRNELYVAMLPAFRALLKPLEAMRVAIYQNRQLIASFGTALANGLNIAIRYLSRILQTFKALSPETKAMITRFAAVGVGIVLIGSRLAFVLPLIQGLAAGLLAVNPVVGAILAVVAAIVGLAAAGNAETFAEGMQNAFKNFSELAAEALPIVMDLLSGFFSLAKSGLTALVGDWSGSWETIRSITLGTLEIMSGLFNNTQLAANAAWTAIKLGLIELLYFNVVTVPKMIWDAMVWLWDNLPRLAQSAFDYIVQAAISTAEAIVGAFREAWNMIMSGDFSVANIAARIGEAFQRGMANAASGARWFVNAEWRDSLRQELSDQVAALRRSREQRQTQPNNRPAAQEDTAPPPIRNPKFESVGLTDLYKKVQENIAGTSMVNLQQRHLEVANQQHRELRTQTSVLTDIRNSVREPNVARAG